MLEGDCVILVKMTQSPPKEVAPSKDQSHLQKVTKYDQSPPREANKKTGNKINGAVIGSSLPTCMVNLV